MDDPDLARIRQERLSAIQARGSSGSPSGGLPAGIRPSGGGGQDEDASRQRAEQEDEMKRTVLSQALDAKARERLSTLALVKPEVERRITAIILQAARSGQLREKLTEERLIGLLNQVQSEANKQTQSSIKVVRRKGADSEDDDDFSPPTTAGKADDSDDDFDL